MALQIAAAACSAAAGRGARRDTVMADRRMIRESVDREDEEFRFSFCCDMHAAKAAKMVMKCVYAIQVTHFAMFIFYSHPNAISLVMEIILVSLLSYGVYGSHRSYFVTLIVWEIEILLQDIYFTLLVSANDNVIRALHPRLVEFIDNKEVYVICFALACVFEFLLFILFYNVMSTFNTFLKDQEKAKIESTRLKELKTSSDPEETTSSYFRDHWNCVLRKYSIAVRKESGQTAGDSKKVEQKPSLS